MKNITVVAMFMGCLLAGAASPAGAFRLSGAGLRTGVVEPEDLDSTVPIGGHLEFEQPGSRVHLQASLMYWNSDRYSDTNPNFDAYYHFAPAGLVSPYLGAGLGLHFLSFSGRRFTGESETNAGVNMLGGVLFPGRAARFFLEGRLAATDLNTVSILGGVTFPIHR